MMCHVDFSQQRCRRMRKDGDWRWINRLTTGYSSKEMETSKGELRREKWKSDSDEGWANIKDKRFTKGKE